MLFLFFFFFLVILLISLSSIIALSPAKPTNKCGRVPYDLDQPCSVSLVIYFHPIMAAGALGRSKCPEN